MSTPGRVTLKQALREYPGDVRSAAARVRDEWRKLTAPHYPRLRLPEKMTPADRSRSEAEERARARPLAQSRFLLCFCLAWILLQAGTYLVSLVYPTSYSSAPVPRLLLLNVLSGVMVFELMFFSRSLFELARYGEWVKTPPQQP